MLVETMYNKLALNTGFPLYVNETSTPETTRFLLEMLSQSLLNIIDTIYVSNNVLEKRDTIILTPGVDHYAVDGMVKYLQYTQDQRNLHVKGRRIPFNFGIDNPGMITRTNRYGIPTTYIIDRGDIRFFPIPDRELVVQVVSSTTDLVWANDDSSRNSIEDIRDSVMASKAFCDLVILKACALTMARCQNQMAQFYNNLYQQRLRTFIERDSRSFEQPHLYNPRKGHYEPRRGLLD